MCEFCEKLYQTCNGMLGVNPLVIALLLIFPVNDYFLHIKFYSQNDDNIEKSNLSGI